MTLPMGFAKRCARKIWKNNIMDITHKHLFHQPSISSTFNGILPNPSNQFGFLHGSFLCVSPSHSYQAPVPTLNSISNFLGPSFHGFARHVQLQNGFPTSLHVQSHTNLLSVATVCHSPNRTVGWGGIAPWMCISSYIQSIQYGSIPDNDESFSPFSRMSSDSNHPARFLIVQLRIHPPSDLKSKLIEAIRLADALGTPRHSKFGDESAILNGYHPWIVVQNRESGKNVMTDKKIISGWFFGKGTIESIKSHLLASTQKTPVDAIIVNTSLSAVQQRNLESVWKIPVLDRVALIIEIFGAHAHTKEAKLQVALAALEYRSSRLIRSQGQDRSKFGLSGEEEVVSARGRGGGGGRGFLSGAGETELQLQRRRISVKRDRLKLQLVEIQRTRSLHRHARQRQNESGHKIPVIAVVGYTNAGKTTLINTLSQSHLYADDRLFATLDSRLRSILLPSGRKVLLSDTVGFIADLPVQLIEAFKSTLEEVVESDLILHVVDSSASNVKDQILSVIQVLHNLGIPNHRLKENLIEAWNKSDLLPKNGSKEEKGSSLEVFNWLGEEKLIKHDHHRIKRSTSEWDLSGAQKGNEENEEKEEGDYETATDDTEDEKGEKMGSSEKEIIEVVEANNGDKDKLNVEINGQELEGTRKKVDEAQISFANYLREDPHEGEATVLYPSAHRSRKGNDLEDSIVDGWDSKKKKPWIIPDHFKLNKLEISSQEGLDLDGLNHVPKIFVSATHGTGLNDLLQTIDAALDKKQKRK